MTRERSAKDLDVEAAGVILDSAISGETPRVKATTKTARLQELRPKIQALRTRGYSWEEIAGLLKSVGAGNKDTLRYAMTKKTKKPREHAAKEKREPETNIPKKAESKVTLRTPTATSNEHAAQRRAGREA